MSLQKWSGNSYIDDEHLHRNYHSWKSKYLYQGNFINRYFIVKILPSDYWYSFFNGYIILKEFSSVTYLTKYNDIKYASRNLRNKIAFNLVGSKKDCEGHLFTIQGSNSFVIIPKSKINVSTTTYHGAYELNSMRHNFLHSIFRSFSVCYWRN